MGNHQHLLLVAQCLELAEQPLDAGIETPPGRVMLDRGIVQGAIGGLGIEPGVVRAQVRCGQAGGEVIVALSEFLELVLVGRRHRQRGDVQVTFGKAADMTAAVAKHDPAGAVAIQQLFAQLAAGAVALGLVAFGIQQGVEQRAAVAVVDDGAKTVAVGGIARQPLECLDRFGHGGIAGFFFPEAFEIVIAIGIEQTQPGEVALQAHLLRCRGQQQQTGDMLRQAFDAGIAGAFRLWRPIEMVRFVDDQQIPLGALGLALAMRVGEQPLLTGQDALAAVEGVVLVECLALGFVQQRDREREAAQQLDQPLVGQAGGHQNQRPAGAPGQQQAMQDQPGLDGLAQADFVGQQDARGMAPGDFVGDIELVRNQIDARPGQAQCGATGDALVVMQRAIAQLEPVVAVDLAGQQAILGLMEAHVVGELGFAERHGFTVIGLAVVDHAAIAFFDMLDGQLVAVGGIDAITGAEHHAGQRCLTGAVGTGFLTGGEQHGDAACIDGENGAESKLGFAVADPTLAGREVAHDASVVCTLRGTDRMGDAF